ncbi:MAG: hypothetical protein COA99_13325 [Moraxellaceae bacterium]|nr:MAG: hypothetical protein COA99_13325 [Moraxellaceae bacterium]
MLPEYRVLASPRVVSDTLIQTSPLMDVPGGALVNIVRERNHGFTMIELIMVIVVLGILAVSASSLFTTKSNYVAFIAKDQLISMSLLAQQAALAQQNTNIVLCILQSADDWTFEVRETDCSGALYVQATTERTNVGLTQNGSAFSSPQTFAYNTLASLSSGSNVTFVFDGDVDETVCLASTGYAYEGTCQL